MQLHLGSVGDEAMDLSVTHALLRQASAGEIDEALRVYQPSAPAAVFGRRDMRLPGFEAARAAALAHGFGTFVRPTGGRAVAYTQAALIVDHVRREPGSSFGTEERFRQYGALLADALRGLGIDAQVGAVPGEYCPGAHSVNARGLVKLVGTAQRAVRDAWLFSSLVVVGGSAAIRPVLDAIYGRLALPFDSASVGALSEERPGLDIADVESATFSAYGVDRSRAIDLAPEVLARAEESRGDHLA
jgi:lipoate-protein ligase A